MLVKLQNISTKELSDKKMVILIPFFLLELRKKLEKVRTKEKIAKDEKRIMIKQIVAIDMDGTLLDSKKRLPPDFIPWVISHPQIQTIIASGRQFYTLQNMFSEIAEQLVFICDNGGLVFEKGEAVYKNVLSDENLQRCITYIETLPNVVMILCGVKAAYMQTTTDEVYKETGNYYARLKTVENPVDCIKKDSIVKVAIYVKNHDAEALYNCFPNLSDDLAVVLSGSDWIDISNKSASKGDALKIVQKRLGITKENSTAFGDYLNDYTLLQECGESYAMSNGHPDLKAIAKYIAPSNDEDGVMRILRRLHKTHPDKTVQ